MNILFMGTPDFAVSALKSIVDAGHTITSVITQPDKPKGRGHKMAHPPVYDYAESMNFQIHQPESLKNNAIEDILSNEKPDLIVVVAYGKILPEYILNYPKFGCINVHASLLPKYRGAAPIQRCIIDGEKETGVTTMYMAKGLDTGDMIEKITVPIEEDDNFESLHDKLASAGGKVIVSTINAVENGTVSRTVQDETLSTYAEMITKETARINWSKSAYDIHNQIRGLCPVPKAFSEFNSIPVKITLSKVAECTSKYDCGTVIYVGTEYIRVKCFGDTAIDILEIQPAGKRVMSVNDYLKGNSVSIGDKFV